jgi:hypothetical protein
MMGDEDTTGWLGHGEHVYLHDRQWNERHPDDAKKGQKEDILDYQIPPVASAPLLFQSPTPIPESNGL